MANGHLISTDDLEKAKADSSFYLAESSDRNPVPDGAWHGNFTKCKKYADDHHVPLFAYWSRENCSRCTNCETNVFSTKKFHDFMKSSGILWNYNYQKTTEDDRNAEKFVRNITSDKVQVSGAAKYTLQMTGLPFCCLYWKVNGGFVLKLCFTGMMRQLPILKGTKDSNFVDGMIATIKYFTRFYVPENQT